MAKSIIIKYFEVRSPDDNYGLELRSEETEGLLETLDGINRVYRSALKRGYDNRHRKWVIVCTHITKTIDGDGNLITEATSRRVVAKAEFSASHGAFVFV